MAIKQSAEMDSFPETVGDSVRFSGDCSREEIFLILLSLGGCLHFINVIFCFNKWQSSPYDILSSLGVEPWVGLTKTLGYFVILIQH